MSAPGFLRSLFAPPRDYSTQIIRGSQIIPIRNAYAFVRRRIHPRENIVIWAGLPFPDHMCANHFLFCGGTGSGKTVSLRLLLQSLVDTIVPGSDRRLLIHDPKGDMMSLLDGLDCPCPIDLLNAFDLRSIAIDWAQEIDSPGATLQMASTIIEADGSGHNQNAFFYKAAQDLFAAVLQALIITKPRRWELAEVLLILSNRNRTEALLRRCPQTRPQADEHFDRSQSTLDNVMYTISAYVAMLRPIAALGARAAKKISLQEWISSESILVLGTAPSLRAPQQAINNLLVQRIAELVLSQDESDDRRTWFLLDEARELAYCKEALARLLDMGRSKGARMAVIIQTIEGFQATFGKFADEIAAMCGNKAFLQCDSQATAEWSSKTIGEAELRRWMKNHNPNGLGGRDSMGEQIVITPAVLASEIMRMPRATRRRFFGYYVSPSLGCFHGPVHFSRVLARRGDAPNFIPRPVEHQYLPEHLLATDGPQDHGIRLADITRKDVLSTAQERNQS